MAIDTNNGGSSSPTDRDLQVATQALRDHTDERWVEIADSMLAGVLARSRPSHPVRGQVGSESFHVSDQVLTNYLLAAIDPIPQVEVDAINIHSDQDRYTGVTIVISVQHGLSLVPVADMIREAAEACLIDMLGRSTPPITVSTMHVHVEDVTPEDPSLS